MMTEGEAVSYHAPGGWMDLPMLQRTHEETRRD